MRKSGGQKIQEREIVKQKLTPNPSNKEDPLSEGQKGAAEKTLDNSSLEN